MPGEGRCEGKKRPEGDSPSGLKQTDDSLKILSYGDGGVMQVSRPILALIGKQRWALEHC